MKIESMIARRRKKIKNIFWKINRLSMVFSRHMNTVFMHSVRFRFWFKTSYFGIYNEKILVISLKIYFYYLSTIIKEFVDWPRKIKTLFEETVNVYIHNQIIVLDYFFVLASDMWWKISGKTEYKHLIQF